LYLSSSTYLKGSAGLKPKADLAKAEIRECESKIEAAQNATKDTKEQVVVMQKRKKSWKGTRRVAEEGR
jgi:hypothetical protein